MRELMEVARSWICLLISILPSFSPLTASLNLSILFFRFWTFNRPSTLPCSRKSTSVIKNYKVAGWHYWYIWFMNNELMGDKWFERMKTGTHRGLCLLLHNHMRTVFWILMQALALYLILFFTAGKGGKGQGEYIFSFRRTIMEQRQVFYFTNALLSVPSKQGMINKKPCFHC